ncbi:MAG: hypothetical protein SF162_03730 [bacterium]|nr:hypothetical protein [bacterium]
MSDSSLPVRRARPGLGSLVSDSLTLLELRSDPHAAARSFSTRALDWAFVILAMFMSFGLWLDIWSHATFGPDQSVLNPFHMLFYSAGAALGLLLLYIQFNALSRRTAWMHSFPRGYGLGAFGLLIFGISGVVDLITHALFGFETGFEATLSPSHTGLFIGWFIITMTPARALLARRAQEPSTLGAFLPALIGTALALSAITTIIVFSIVIGSQPFALQAFRDATLDDYNYTLGIMSQFIQTGAVASFVIWLAVHFRLPFGWVTLLYTLYMLFLLLIGQDVTAIPIMLIAGVLTDALYAVIRPQPGERGALRLFGLLMPLALWGTYYLFFIVTGIYGGVWFTPYVWIGSVIQSGFIGAFIAYFMTLTSAPRAVET